MVPPRTFRVHESLSAQPLPPRKSWKTVAELPSSRWRFPFLPQVSARTSRASLTADDQMPDHLLDPEQSSTGSTEYVGSVLSGSRGDHRGSPRHARGWALSPTARDILPAQAVVLEPSASGSPGVARGLLRIARETARSLPGSPEAGQDPVPWLAKAGHGSRAWIYGFLTARGSKNPRIGSETPGIVTFGVPKPQKVADPARFCQSEGPRTQIGHFSTLKPEKSGLNRLARPI